MLYPSDAVVQEFTGLLSELEKPGCDSGAIFQRLIDVDPLFAPAYDVLAARHAERGDLHQAESLVWKALELWPCDYSLYYHLAVIRLERIPGDAMARRLHHLGISKLALLDEIPEAAMEEFSELFGSTANASDPVLYEALAIAEGARLKDSPQPPEVEKRLLPYVLLNDLQREAPSVVAHQTMSRIIEHASECVPLLRAALREWARELGHVSDPTAAMIIALLGETGDLEVLDELMELMEDERVFRSVHWAIHRLAERYPQQALAAFCASTMDAPLGWRCGLAEQMYVMAPMPDLDDALARLLDGFSRFGRQTNAPHLLLVVVEALERLGSRERARALLARCEPMLTKTERQWVRAVRSGEAEFTTTLAAEGLIGPDIEDVCLERCLLHEDEDDEEAEDLDGPFEDDEEEVFDEQEELFPEYEPEPAPKLGRNDPCWCGSGKKYKKCHLNADEESARGDQSRGSNLRQPKLMSDIADYMTRYISEAEQERAKLLYFDTPGEVEVEVEVDHTELEGFIQWLVTDFRNAETGRTVLEDYAEKPELSARDRDFVQSLRDARFGVYEVQQVEQGRGVHVKNLYTDETLFVKDVSASRVLVRWDCALMRVHGFEGVTFFVGSGALVPRELLEQFRAWVAEESPAAGQTESDFIQANSHRLHRVLTQFQIDRIENLKVVNREGDAMEFAQANYQVLDEDALIARLRGLEDLVEQPDSEEPDTYHFGWLEAGGSGGGRTSFGQVAIRNSRLRLECNSRKRLAKGRRLLERHAKAHLKHLGDSFESLPAALERHKGEKPAKPRGAIPPEVEREILLKVKSEHYAKWPDEKLPALQGKTARQAVKTSAGRLAVENLVRTMENLEERERKRGKPAFDFTPLRRELGLTEP